MGIASNGLIETILQPDLVSDIVSNEIRISNFNLFEVRLENESQAELNNGLLFLLDKASILSWSSDDRVDLTEDMSY